MLRFPFSIPHFRHENVPTLLPFLGPFLSTHRARAGTWVYSGAHEHFPIPAEIDKIAAQYTFGGIIAVRQLTNNHQPERKMNRTISLCFLAAMLAVPAMATESTPDTSDRLTTARQKLSELRMHYEDQHPAVQAQLRKIEDLERQATARQQEPAELRAAKEKLAELRRRYEDQMRKVEELERQALRRTNESAELQAARARLAKAKQMYLKRHPKYQEALRKVQELERQQPGTK